MRGSACYLSLITELPREHLWLECSTRNLQDVQILDLPLSMHVVMHLIDTNLAIILCSVSSGQLFHYHVIDT